MEALSESSSSSVKIDDKEPEIQFPEPVIRLPRFRVYKTEARRLGFPAV